MMYKGFYGFREKPFGLAADPGYLYLSSKHRLALSYLEYALLDGAGFALLTGEIGSGKTTIIKQLLLQIGRDIATAVVFNTNVSPEQLLETILQEFDLERPQGGKTQYWEVLNQFLLDRYSRGHRAVLIVDEAQNLSVEALEEIRMISNLQTDKDSLLQVILVGQPSLRARLQQPAFSQLTQRIVVSYHLTALSQEETGDYIQHRLKKAGSENQDLFTPGAVAAVYRHSMGIPRTINLLCDAALVYGYADELRTIHTDLIEQVVQDRAEMGILPALDPDVDRGAVAGGSRQQDNALLHRLQTLEESMARFASIAGRTGPERSRPSQESQDRLVSAIDRLLEREHERNEKLMALYQNLASTLGANPEPAKPVADVFPGAREEAHSRSKERPPEPPARSQSVQTDPSARPPEDSESDIPEGVDLLFSKALDKHEQDQARKAGGSSSKRQTPRQGKRKL